MLVLFNTCGKFWHAMGICCISQETQTGALCQPRGVGWEGRWEGGSRVGDICVPMADSCWGLT